MILDKYLVLCKRTDTPAVNTKAVALGQGDLAPATDGMGPYQDFWLCVMAGAAGAAVVTIKLQHSDLETGPFADVATYTSPATFDLGDIILKVPVPFRVKNWLRVNFSAAAPRDAFFVYGVDKGVVIND